MKIIEELLLKNDLLELGTCMYVVYVLFSHQTHGIHWRRNFNHLLMEGFNKEKLHTKESY